MRRYQFLSKENIYEALNRLRDAFLAAKDGNEVNQIINGLLTHDEKVKIGRRIIIAEWIESGMTIEEIARNLKVGKSTILSVMRNLDLDATFYKLIKTRTKKVTKEYADKKFKEVGGATLIFKKKQYTGFKRKDVSR